MRHGETDWNSTERFRGRSDVGLNEHGRRQARQIAAAIPRYGAVSAILSSPLPRAVQTAQPIADVYQVPVQPEADLLDIDYGGWEGLSAKEAEEKDPALYETWLKRPGRVKFPGGESVRQVRARVENLLNGLTEGHLGENIVLVSHRITCHVLLCTALGLSNDHLWRLKQDVACLNVIERRDDNWLVAQLNDTNHLHGHG